MLFDNMAIIDVRCLVQNNFKNTDNLLITLGNTSDKNNIHSQVHNRFLARGLSPRRNKTSKTSDNIGHVKSILKYFSHLLFCNRNIFDTPYRPK